MNESTQLKTESASQQQAEKKPYEAPKLTRHGQVDDLTKQSTPGPSGGPISNPSDRNLKDNFNAVDAQGVLEKLAQIPITTWNYKSDFANIRHMGPMAQDFAKAFGLGNTDRVIHTIDSAGVTMAAVQALYRLALEQSERISALESEVRQLRESSAAV